MCCWNKLHILMPGQYRINISSSITIFLKQQLFVNLTFALMVSGRFAYKMFHLEDLPENSIAKQCLQMSTQHKIKRPPLCYQLMKFLNYMVVFIT